MHKYHSLSSHTALVDADVFSSITRRHTRIPKCNIFSQPCTESKPVYTTYHLLPYSAPPDNFYMRSRSSVSVVMLKWCWMCWALKSWMEKNEGSRFVDARQLFSKFGLFAWNMHDAQGTLSAVRYARWKMENRAIGGCQEANSQAMHGLHVVKISTQLSARSWSIE